jgi:hypothetical protein
MHANLIHALVIQYAVKHSELKGGVAVVSPYKLLEHLIFLHKDSKINRINEYGAIME